MANYKFDEINGGVAITNPVITICNVDDKRNGTAIIYVLIQEGNPSPNFNLSFIVPLLKSTFTYSGDQPMKTDVDAWFDIEIQTYIVP